MGTFSIADSLRISLKTPKTQIGILLTAIFATAFMQTPSPTLLTTYLLSIVGTVAADLLFLRARNVPLYFPSAALVTGTIISLVLAPNPPWYQPLIVGALAMASKHIIRFQRPIFNPACFGLLAGALLFNTPISWWGASWQQFFYFPSTIYFLVLISPTLVSILRMRKHQIILSFLFVYNLLSYFSTPIQLDHPFVKLFDPTVLFFSLVMLPEPMTSPARPLQQILYGISIAVLSLLASFPPISNAVPDPLIGALLVSNLAFSRFR